MARKADTAKRTEKKPRATKAGASKSRASKSSMLSYEDHERAAYFNWLKRGAPLWDDQQDWYSVN